jgi:hypothetical protein
MRGDDAACAGKKAFPTYWKARKNARGLNRHFDNAKANIYRCSSCRYYHTGNTLKSDTAKQHYERRGRYNERWYRSTTTDEDYQMAKG